MRYSVLSVALLGLFVRGSTARLCDPSNATPIEQIVGSGGGGGGGGGGGVYVTFHGTEYIKRRTTPDAKLAHVPVILSTRAADSVQCTTAEVCASADDAIFCYNENTGDFHDTEGTYGNLITGDYVLADGRRGNLYSSSAPGPTGNGRGATTTPAIVAPTAAATTGRAATAAGAGNAVPTTNAASNGGFRSRVGGLLALLCAGLL